MVILIIRVGATKQEEITPLIPLKKHLRHYLTIFYQSIYFTRGGLVAHLSEQTP
jgi:hypothetical protein